MTKKSQQQDAQQGRFPGFEPAPALTDRLFFAVLPDAGAVTRIAALAVELKAQLGLRGRRIADGRLHATLCNLGDYPGMPQRLVERAGEVAAAVGSASAPFNVGFDTALSFLNRPRDRPFVLSSGDGDGVAGLRALYQQLAHALIKAGLPANPASYTPHVTLLYDDAAIAAHNVAPVEWTVRELVLVHSQLGQNLPYQALGRWPLGSS